MKRKFDEFMKQQDEGDEKSKQPTLINKYCRKQNTSLPPKNQDRSHAEYIYAMFILKRSETLI